MLMRISLFVAIIAGLVVGGLNFVMVKDKITKLQADLKEQTDARQKAESDLAKTRDDLKKTTAELKQTQATLQATTEQKDTAVAEAASQTKRADKLTDDLNKTRKERDDAQAELAAYRATGLTPDQISAVNTQNKTLQKTLAGIEAENKVLGRKVTGLQTELARYKDPEKLVYLPATLKGKILVCDPKWNFVILNVGGDQGVLEYGELLVNRNGKLVAKIKVSSVQKDRCVANIVPGWQIGELIEGDQVIPAHPAES